MENPLFHTLEAPKKRYFKLISAYLRRSTSQLSECRWAKFRPGYLRSGTVNGFIMIIRNTPAHHWDARGHHKITRTSENACIAQKGLKLVNLATKTRSKNLKNMKK